MKKYIIALICLIAAFGGYMALVKNKNSQTDSTGREGHSPAQYEMQITAGIDNLQPGQPTQLNYKIVDGTGAAVKDFAVAHEKIMHLIVVRKDLQEFQHLHPEFNPATGEFSTNITFPSDGPYRLFPDFTPANGNPQNLTVTLTTDIDVGDASRYQAQVLESDPETMKSVEGFKVGYYFSEQLKSKQAVEYSLIVEQGIEQVELEPYLGAMGHSVIIREGTLDFIHTHAEGMHMEGMDMSPEEHAGHIGEPDTIDFTTEFPEPGLYKIFTQFQVNGKVLTTDYTVRVE